jgi:hypothetical protein
MPGLARNLVSEVTWPGQASNLVSELLDRDLESGAVLVHRKRATVKCKLHVLSPKCAFLLILMCPHVMKPVISCRRRLVYF